MIATIEGLRSPAAPKPLPAATQVSVRLEPDGRVIVESDLPDVGASIYIVAAQIAAETLGVSIERVVVRLAHSAHLGGAGAGASWGASNVCIAVDRACRLLKRILRTATGDGAPNDLAAAVCRHFPDGLQATGRTLVQMHEPHFTPIRATARSCPALLTPERSPRHGSDARSPAASATTAASSA